MKKTLVLIALVFLLPTAICFAQKNSKKEITKVDVFAAKQMNGANISVYGIYLGMNKAEAKKILTSNKKLIVEDDGFNTKSKDDNDNLELRLYVYDINPTTGKKGNCLLYVIWDNESVGIDRITMFEDCKNLVVGNTKKMFTKDVINASSSFYKKYLENPTQKKEGDYTNTFFYKEKNIEIIEYKRKNDDNKYYFSLTKKGK
ncbi:MAG: hypothetical protein KA319_07375 [Ferruginibacter sp.]|nr:hypothetical protein [Ferruginibacter sp.]